MHIQGERLRGRAQELAFTGSNAPGAVLREAYLDAKRDHLWRLELAAARGELPLPERVRFVDRAQLKGKNAVDGHRDGGGVLVAEDLRGNPDLAFRAFAEEAGHHLDRRLAGEGMEVAHPGLGCEVGVATPANPDRSARRNVHRKARLTPQGRALMISRVLDGGWRVAAAAGLPERRACEWLRRFRAGGVDGRRFRMLVVVDDFSRECLALVADSSLSGRRVARELDRVVERRGLPHQIVGDNRPSAGGRSDLRGRRGQEAAKGGPS